MQLTSYKDRLIQHIDQYLAVVLEMPNVRHNEFEQLKKFARLDNPRNILEIPAEIGMLERVYPAASIDRMDWLEVQLNEYRRKILKTDFHLTSAKRCFYDAVLGVVPIHHATHEEKKSYVAGAFSALKNTGTLCFAEVEEGSSVHKFLDEFINDYSFTGHKGDYVTDEFSKTLSDAGFQKVCTDNLSCPWVFDSTHQLIDFNMRLFNLKPMTENFLLTHLDKYLGIQELLGKITLGWNLRYFRGVRVD